MSDNSATMAPAECLALDGAAEAAVYADSGSWAEHDQSLNDGDEFTHYLKQAVVLFPTPEKAGAFLDASAQQWSACRQYTHLESGTTWSVGQMSNANRALSTTTTEHDAAAPPGWGLRTRIGAAQQRGHRRKHLQRRPPHEFGVDDRRPDRRQHCRAMVTSGHGQTAHSCSRRNVAAVVELIGWRGRPLLDRRHLAPPAMVSACLIGCAHLLVFRAIAGSGCRAYGPFRCSPAWSVRATPKGAAAAPAPSLWPMRGSDR